MRTGICNAPEYRHRKLHDQMPLAMSVSATWADGTLVAMSLLDTPQSKYRHEHVDTLGNGRNDSSGRSRGTGDSADASQSCASMAGRVPCTGRRWRYRIASRAPIPDYAPGLAQAWPKLPAVIALP
jgi:hypothetical protein